MNTLVKISRKNAQESQKFNWFLFLHFLGLLCLFVASPVFAYSGGDGSPENPYQIADVNDLLYLSADEPNYSKCFILTNDINLAGRAFNTAVISRDTENEIENFQGTPFTGVFNGAEHKIINMTINAISSYSYIGLFGCVGSSGEVNNLTLENINLTGGNGSEYFGGLAGYNFGGTINNCSAIGTITGNACIGGLGGLVGISRYGNISYSSSLVNINITGENVSGSIGGLVGVNEKGTIKNCSSNIIVSSGFDSSGVGGLIGFNLGEILNCHSEGLVINGGTTIEYPPSTAIGGLIGLNGSTYDSHGNIADSWSSCDVIGGHGAYYIGGLVGDTYGLYHDSYISNCYSTGTVNSSNSFQIGGLVGHNYGFINQCFTISTVIGEGSSSYIGGLVGSNTYLIHQSFSTGPISGGNNSTYLGGLVGSDYFDSDYENVSDCYSLSIVNSGTGSSYIAGLVGYKMNGKIKNCYSTGDVNTGSDSSAVGGMIGLIEFADINHCYFLENSGPDNDFGEPLTDGQMKKLASFIGWDFLGETINGTEEIWWILENVTYPKFNWQRIQPPTSNDNDGGSYFPDYDFDNFVNFFDFAVFADAWLTENPFISLDEDTVVDIYDLKIFCNDWLESAF